MIEVSNVAGRAISAIKAGWDAEEVQNCAPWDGMKPHGRLLFLEKMGVTGFGAVAISGSCYADLSSVRRAVVDAAIRQYKLQKRNRDIVAGLAS